MRLQTLTLIYTAAITACAAAPYVDTQKLLRRADQPIVRFGEATVYAFPTAGFGITAKGEIADVIIRRTPEGGIDWLHYGAEQDL